jgi:hypothetical protein
MEMTLRSDVAASVGYLVYFRVSNTALFIRLEKLL